MTVFEERRKRKAQAQAKEKEERRRQQPQPWLIAAGSHGARPPLGTDQDKCDCSLCQRGN
jgi:hypothetical protein